MPPMLPLFLDTSSSTKLLEATEAESKTGGESSLLFSLPLTTDSAGGESILLFCSSITGMFGGPSAWSGT